MKISFQIEGTDRGCTAECDLEPGDGQRPQRHERRLRPRCLHDTTSRRGGIADLPRTGLCPNRNQPRPPRGHTPPGACKRESKTNTLPTYYSDLFFPRADEATASTPTRTHYPYTGHLLTMSVDTSQLFLVVWALSSHDGWGKWQNLVR